MRRGDRDGDRPERPDQLRGEFDQRPASYDRQPGYGRRGPSGGGSGGFDARRLGPGARPQQHQGRGAPGGAAPPLRSAIAAPPAEPPIDREKVCPLLLRVFPRVGAHHRLEEFARRGDEPREEVQIYTWPDATLRELCELVKEVNPAARRAQAKVSFALVYPDRSGRSVMRQAGVVHAQRPGADDAATLRSIKFATGDFLSVAVY